MIVGGFASTPLIDRVLSIYPLQRTGDVSYSLYLWHWPLLVLFVPATGGRLTKVSLVALAYVLAVITYELVEQPPRRLIKSPARTYQFGGALIAVGLVAAYGAARLPRLNAGIAVRDPPGVAPAFAPEPGFVPSNLRPPLDRAAKDFAPLFVRCSASFEPSIPRLCGAGTIAPRRTMVVFGDSHAAQWVGPLAQIARTRGWSLDNLTKADCPASEVRVFVITPLNGEYHACDAWRARAISVIARLKPALTVVSSARSYGYPGVPRSAFRARVEAGLLNTLRMVARAGPVLSLADTPQFRSSRPVCLSGQLHDPASCGAPARVAADPGYTALERRAAAAAGVDFADLNSVICPAGACDPIHGNLLIYADNNHLTATFVDALEPELAAVVKSALTARTRTRVHAASGVQIMHSSIMRPNTVTLRHPSS